MAKEKPPTWEKFCVASDESGKGDFFGGLVVAAVYLNEEILEKLKKESYYSKIKDSKELKNKVEEFATKIIKILDKNFKFLVVPPKQYNDLYSKCKNQHLILALLHNDVHLRLKNKFQTNAFTIVDKFWKKKTYYWNLKKQNIQYVEINDMEPQAEKRYLACAIASIIARYYYLQQIQKMNEKYEILIPIGRKYQERQRLITAFKELKTRAKPEEFCKIDFRIFWILKEINALKELKEKCPLCKSKLDYFFNWYKKIFICCTKFPNCHYEEYLSKPEKILKNQCWICHSPIILKYSKKYKRFYFSCSKYCRPFGGRNLNLPIGIKN